MRKETKRPIDVIFCVMIFRGPESDFLSRTRMKSWAIASLRNNYGQWKQGPRADEKIR